MAKGVADKGGNVVELGGGTGRITRGILSAGVPAENLTVMEMNPAFCTLLRQRFPGVLVENRAAQGLVHLGLSKVRTVISGLPLLNMPQSVQDDIISATFDALDPGGTFVQFTYGQKIPLFRDVVARHDLSWEKQDTIWLNLPPARVFTFRKRQNNQLRPD